MMIINLSAAASAELIEEVMKPGELDDAIRLRLIALIAQAALLDLEQYERQTEMERQEETREERAAKKAAKLAAEKAGEAEVS